VLLVDGDWQDSVRRAEGLLLSGWEVAIATSGEDALAAMDDFLPDAIITETHLNGALDGLALARRVKRDAGTQRISIIVLTDQSTGEGDECATILECGTRLAKPCDGSAVLAALESEVAIAGLLATRRARRSAAVMAS